MGLIWRRGAGLNREWTPINAKDRPLTLTLSPGGGEGTAPLLSEQITSKIRIRIKSAGGRG